MRKIIVGAFISLDGVMQAPGGPEEDPVGGFRFGGWFAPQFDETIGAAMGELFGKPFALLLGRKTYDIFAAHWPYQQEDDPFAAVLNRAAKYVATRRPEMKLAWENSQTLGEDVLATLRSLKKEDRPDLLTQGSTELVHTLLQHDLVDELNVLTSPLILGRGKKLFNDDGAPGALKLIDSKVSTTGVIIARYRRAGDVATGSFADSNPSAAELERRRNLQ